MAATSLPELSELNGNSAFLVARNVSYLPSSKVGNALQNLNIYIPKPSTATTTDTEAQRRIWLVYIHGGAWRDPLITSASIEPALRSLTDIPEEQQKQSVPSFSKIAGIASISYTLSSHPSHLDSTNDPSRMGRHPDHLKDVTTALHWLGKNSHLYTSREILEDSQPVFEYILLGHSCGGTLALQAIFGKDVLLDDGSLNEIILKPPQLLMSIAGLHDLPMLVRAPGLDHDAYKDVYREIVAGAFGSNEELWARVSPTHLPLNAHLHKQIVGMKPPRLIVLAQSRRDSLVPWNQITAMSDAFTAAGWITSEYSDAIFGHEEGQDKNNAKVILHEIAGDHDDVWSNGSGLAKLIQLAIDAMT